MKKLAVATVALAILLFAAGCGQSSSTATSSSPESSPESSSSARTERVEVGEEIRADGGSFTRVSPEELKRTAGRRDFVLVNTHIPFAGDLPDTDLSIAYNEISDNLDKLPGKDERIVLYCRSGSMSNEAARTLVSLGYTNVWDLGGGMNAWRGAGFELVGV